MFKRTVTYTDFDGVERTEDVFFHLSESELIEMELGREGRMTAALDRIVKAKDIPSLVKEFKSLVLMAYGEKSADGRRFVKSEELREAFSQTPVYNKLFMEFVLDDKAAADFIQQLIPSDLADKVKNSPEVKNALSGETTPEMKVLK